MGIDNSDFDRLAAGETLRDDAAVSAFLDDLRSAYPPGSTAGIEAGHLAAVAREVRSLPATARSTGANVVSMRAARFRRVLVSSVAGSVVLLTAGVGAAAAMGFNPIAQLVAPRIDQHMPVTPPALPSAGNPSAPDGGRPGHKPSSAPSVPPTSVPTPTGTPTDATTADPTESAKPEKVKKDKKDKTDKVKKDKKDKTDKTKDKKDKTDKTNNGTKKTSP